MSKTKRILLISPHPDDIEFFASNLCMQAVELGWDTHELIMCCDEYGTSVDEFKGKRMRRIRRQEMFDSAQHYGKIIENGVERLKIKLHWADYIDGFVPFTEQSVLRMQKFIRKVDPYLIIGPSPHVYFDGHTDHKATGKNYYYALKKMKKRERPTIMLYYQSLMPDVFLESRDRQTREKAWHEHGTQMSVPVILFWKLKQLLYFPALIRHNAGFFGEGYRRVNFDQETDRPRGFAKVLFRHIFSKGGWGDQDPRLFIPTPNDLGLEICPDYDIE